MTSSSETSDFASLIGEARQVAVELEVSLTRATGAMPDIPGYETRHEIHRGGQGVVFRARQLSTGRDVAIKIVRRGPLDGPREQARFDREVRILGQLRHPNIVPVFDSGIARGCHYFVMPFIPGEPLDRYVARVQSGPAETLRLMGTIARSVHAAHQRGIIHRDLKPSNIQVDEEGRPHILDFGLAKMDTEMSTGSSGDHDMTVAGQFLGSLPWSSPEQADGRVDDVDLRTDVYALGAVSYQSLTGSSPFPGRRQRVRLLRDIIEQDPPAPSSLRPDLNDEIDTILLKCLSKGPSQRYASAAALADDIDRHLADQPILARPPTAAYQLRKLVARHKLPSALMAALLVSVIGFAGWMSALYGRAARAETEAESRRVEAERQTETARAVNAFLTERLLGASEPSVARGRETTVEEVLTTASREIRTAFKDQPLVKASVLQTLGRVLAARREMAPAVEHLREAEAIFLQKLGEIHPDTIGTRLALVDALLGPAQTAEGEALGRDTLDLCRRTFGEDHELTLRAAHTYAMALWNLQRMDEAAELLHDTLQRRRRLLGDDDPTTIGTLANWVNPHLLHEGRTSEAKRYASEVLERYRDLYGEDHPSTLGAVSGLADILSARGELQEAEPLYRAAYEGRQRVFGRLNRDTLASAVAYGLVLRNLRRIDEAHTLLRLVVEADALADDDPLRLSALQYLGSVLYRQRDYREAVRVFGELLYLRRRAYGDEDRDTAMALTSYSNLMRTLGRFAEAEQGHREAYQVMLRVHGRGHAATLWTLRGLVRALAAQEKFEEGRPFAEELLEHRRTIAERPEADAAQRIYYVRELLTIEPEDLRDPQRALEVALEAREMITDAFRPDDYWAAMAYRETGDLPAAIETLEDLLDSSPDEESADRGNYERLLVECYVESGAIEEAEGVYRRTLATRRARSPAEDPDIAEAMLNLGRFLLAHDRPGEAIPVLREGLSISQTRWDEDDWRVAEAMSVLGEALTGQSEWDEAEALLLDAQELLGSEEYVPARERRAVAERLVTLYELRGKPHEQ